MDFLIYLGKGEIQNAPFGNVLKIYDGEIIYMSYPTVKATVIHRNENKYKFRGRGNK